MKKKENHKKVELLIKVLDFVEWKFGSYTKEKEILDFMQDELEKTGEFTISLDILFYLSGKFPVYKIVNFKDVPVNFISSDGYIETNEDLYSIKWTKEN